MRLVCRSLCFQLLILVVLGYLTAAAQSKLPSSIAALVPAGSQVTSQSFTKAPTLAAADFAAEKKLLANHSAYYNFHLSSQDASSPLWKMRGPIYQSEMERKVTVKRTAFKPGTNPPITYDPAKETKYGWGAGITQRVVHHYMGAGTGPDYVDYRAAYFGMVGGVLFELTVDGVPSADEADQWAKEVAGKATTLSISNIHE
jgi:hypothetical protein